MTRANMTIRIPDDLMQLLRADAKSNLRSVSATVHIILREHFTPAPPAPADRDLQERLRDTVRGGIGS